MPPCSRDGQFQEAVGTGLSRRDRNGAKPNRFLPAMGGFNRECARFCPAGASGVHNHGNLRGQGSVSADNANGFARQSLQSCITVPTCPQDEQFQDAAGTGLHHQRRRRAQPCQLTRATVGFSGQCAPFCATITTITAAATITAATAATATAPPSNGHARLRSAPDALPPQTGSR